MGRLRGVLWLTAGLVVALVAGFVAFASLARATAQPDPVVQGTTESGPQVPVVVAAQPISVRSTLTTTHLEIQELPVAAVPEGAFRAVDEVVGKLTLVDLYPGEIVLAQRLVDPNVTTGNGRLALVVAEDEVLMAFPAQDLMSNIGVLKPGDHVDLLFSFNFSSGGLVTFDLLQNVTIAAIVGGEIPEGASAPKSPQALLFTISPQDALVLKHIKDAGGTLDIVLRAPDAEEEFVTEPVNEDYLLNRYQIPQ